MEKVIRYKVRWRCTNGWNTVCFDDKDDALYYNSRHENATCWVEERVDGQGWVKTQTLT